MLKWLGFEYQRMFLGEIQWPADPESAHRLYVGVVVQVVERVGVVFDVSGPDPISAARDYLAGRISKDELRVLARPWWRTFYPEDGMDKRTAVMGRLAVSVLDMSCDPVQCDPAQYYGHALDWALQFVGFLGYDLRPISPLMIEDFVRTSEAAADDRARRS